MGKNIGNICKNLSSKYSPNLLDHTKKSATDALKSNLKRIIQRTSEATSDLIGNKTAEKNLKTSKTSPQNSSETIESKRKKNTRFDKEIPKER